MTSRLKRFTQHWSTFSHIGKSCISLRLYNDITWNFVYFCSSWDWILTISFKTFCLIISKIYAVFRYVKICVNLLTSYIGYISFEYHHVSQEPSDIWKSCKLIFIILKVISNKRNLIFVSRHFKIIISSS